jgi:hypothetical protein
MSALEANDTKKEQIEEHLGSVKKNVEEIYK